MADTATDAPARSHLKPRLLSHGAVETHDLAAAGSHLF